MYDEEENQSYIPGKDLTLHYEVHPDLFNSDTIHIKTTYTALSDISQTKILGFFTQAYDYLSQNYTIHRISSIDD